MNASRSSDGRHSMAMLREEEDILIRDGLMEWSVRVIL
jgi:hypothetical protein